VNGVSTRKVERVVEQLGVAGMSKSTVSRMCAGLDEQVTAFRDRPLEGRYPYLWLDAKVEKVRDPMIACAARPWWSPTRSMRPATAR
jgi:putative transposase